MQPVNWPARPTIAYEFSADLPAVAVIAGNNLYPSAFAGLWQGLHQPDWRASSNPALSPAAAYQTFPATQRGPLAADRYHFGRRLSAI